MNNANTKAIIGILVLAFALVGYTEARKEYQRLCDRVEVTQSKIDKVADDSSAAIADVRNTIANLSEIFARSQQESEHATEHASELLLSGESRSPKWPAVRAKFIKSHPVCEACGSKDELNVHHCKSFHEFPELELDPTNLITLCREHHFSVGHLGNWKKTNALVREDAAILRNAVKITIKPTIVMHSGPNCGPCIAWKANSKSTWDRAGWSIDVIEETETKRSWPWFEITDFDGLRFEVSGPLTVDAYYREQKKATQ